MLLALAPSVDPRIVLVGAVVAALLVTLTLLVLRGRRRRSRLASEPIHAMAQPQPSTKITAVDGAALLAAVAEAEAEGTSRRLPGLYLSLAQWRFDSGETRAAEDLLRKCVRAATTADLKETHAKARLALGDIAQASGDPATACEHWQIARNLFHELRQHGEYDAVDQRMLRNGCPTDWVLTDF